MVTSMGSDSSGRKPARTRAVKATTSEHSFVNSLRTDWKMFWAGLVGDDELESEENDPFQTGKLETLSLDQIRELTKLMSGDRKRLNQRLESINKEIDLNTAKLDSLRLVGGDVQETVERLNQLSDLGQNMSVELAKLNDKLKMARSREDSIRKGLA